MIGKKNLLESLACFGISGLIFYLLYMWGKFYPPADGYFVYVVLAIFIIMPLTTLSFSLYLARKRLFTFWIYPITFGFLGYVMAYSIGHFNVWFGLMFSFFPSLVGILLGFLLKKSVGN